MEPVFGSARAVAELGFLVVCGGFVIATLWLVLSKFLKWFQILIFGTDHVSPDTAANSGSAGERLSGLSGDSIIGLKELGVRVVATQAHLNVLTQTVDANQNRLDTLDRSVAALSEDVAVMQAGSGRLSVVGGPEASESSG